MPSLGDSSSAHVALSCEPRAPVLDTAPTLGLEVKGTFDRQLPGLCGRHISMSHQSYF